MSDEEDDDFILNLNSNDDKINEEYREDLGVLISSKFVNNFRKRT